MVQLLSKVPNEILRSAWTAQLARELMLSEEALLSEMKKVDVRVFKNRLEEKATAEIQDLRTVEKLLIGLMLDNEEFIFLAQEIHEKKNYSEKTAEMIDGEINKLLDDAIKVSEKIIKENKSKMDGLVKVLLEKEIVEQEEFRAIMG